MHIKGLNKSQQTNKTSVGSVSIPCVYSGLPLLVKSEIEKKSPFVIFDSPCLAGLCLNADRDAESREQLGEAKFKWTFTTASGDVVMPSFLFERIEMNGNSITMTGLRKDAELSKLLPNEGPLVGKCIAMFPSSADPSVTQAVDSDPFIAIETRPEQPPTILEELPSEDEKSKVNIGGTKDGKVTADEGDSVLLTCDVQDPATGKAMNNVIYQWVIERKDGKPIDTSALAKDVQFTPGPGGSTLRIIGLRDTASALQARCVVISEASGINRVPGEMPAGPLAPNDQLVSKPIEFDIKPSPAPDKEPDFDVLPELDLVSEGDSRRKYTVVIDGLDESGQLSAPRGSNVILRGRLIDPETGEEVKDDVASGRTLFGVEVQYADGRPAPISTLAEHLHMNAETGELNLTGYRGDALGAEAKGLKLRVVAERMSWSPEMTGGEEEKPEIGTLRKPSRQRFASPFVTVGLSSEEDGSSVHDPRKPIEALPDLTPVVLGLSKCRTLPQKVDGDATLRCKVRGDVTDENDLIFGWEVIRPDGKPVLITGNVAKSLEVVGNKLHLRQLLPVKDRFFGRCMVGRKAGNRAIYNSDFFEIGPDCKSESDTKVSVGEVPTGSTHDLKFRCQAHNTETGESISADSIFLWEFKTTSGDVVLPSHLFGKVSTSGDTIELSRLRSDIDISAYLPDGEVIEGRCVQQSKSGNETGVPSEPFIVIGPSKQDDPRKSKVPGITDVSDADDDKPKVKVTGAPNQIVAADEGQSITLTCQATDAVTNSPINGLTYKWEISLADNSPIDTAALAEKVETMPGPNGEELRLEGLRETANGLRARCIILNTTAPVDIPPGAPDGDKGVLSPGDRQSGEFIHFEIKPSPRPSEKPDFSTIKELVPDGFKPELPGKMERRHSALDSMYIINEYLLEAAHMPHRNRKGWVHIENPLSLALRYGCLTIENKSKVFNMASVAFIWNIYVPSGDPNTNFKVEVEGLDETNNLGATRGSDVVLRGRLIDTRTGEDVTSSLDGTIFGLEARFADGRPAPVSMLADKVIVDAKTGEIKLQGYMGDLLNPDRRDLRVRIVAERTIIPLADSADKVSKPTRQRIASPYFFAYARDENGNQIADARPVAPEYWPITPIVRGLSPCGNLLFEEGSSAVLHCLVEGEPEIHSDFLYGWEFISSYGKPVPLAGVATSARQEGSTLELNDLQKLPMRVFGRCVVGRKSGGSARYTSHYFELGGECDPSAITPVPPLKPEIPATPKSEFTPRTTTPHAPGPESPTPGPESQAPGPESSTPGPESSTPGP
ncbi:unnamed protein product, partial [Dibothriocephalus latus]